MSAKFCAFCWGYFTKVELHHVGGQAHCDRLIPLCRDCHREATTEQHRMGLKLSAVTTSTEGETLCSIVGGYEIARKMTAARMAGNLIQDLSSVSSSVQPQPLYGES